MGKVNKQSTSELSLTPIQRIIFDEFSKDVKLRECFYFTGGTALAGIYLHHRESEDLDFFSENDFSHEQVDDFMNRISKIIKIPFRLTQIAKTRMYELVKLEKVIIKVDFGHYPYKRLRKGIKVSGVTTDHKFDIATNKLHTVTVRNHVKDFVDLYFLLKEFTIWDLFYAHKEKFNTELDLIWLAADFLKVRDFKFLPKMHSPLTLKELQDFYTELAKKLGSRIIES